MIKNSFLSKPVYFVIIIVTLISYQTITDRSIFPNVPKRIELQNSILSGQIEAPYQYRVMEPVLGYSVQYALSFFVKNPLKIHTLSYQIIIFLVFFGIYSLFYSYLRIFFDDVACMVGILILAVLIPLGITSIWEDGDYYTLLFFLIGMICIFRSKDQFLPLIIFIGVYNRNQIVYLLVFYGIYLYEQKELFTKRSIMIFILSIIAFAVGTYSLRLYFGFKESPYKISHEIRTNLDYWFQILTVWSEQVIIFIILSIAAYKRSPLFFRLSFISLIAYVILFFFNSILSQLAKFLPAYLVMIPMSLEILTNQKMKDYNKTANR
ncbi:MAG: hypothetical protein ABI462_01100 [Ignavibacteria bacterium]